MVAINGSVGAKNEHLLEPLPPLQTTSSPKTLDAGLRSLDHYRTRLPLWRYIIRERLIPIVRWETPLLAAAQQRIRSPALDSYFSITANLGTHTFFLVFLPMLFWCDQVRLARSIVTVLASGVFFSGVLKDGLCLPRPLSPPLHRISMHRSTVLEYGFPSTHSTNAVSIAVYVLLMVSSEELSLDPQVATSIQILAYSYATSIIMGRLYCGMHGIFDVVVGSLLGAFISVVQFTYGDHFASLVYGGTIRAPLLAILSVLLLVRVHPEPADDCPCFDDSVAFAGVVIGMWIGAWRTFMPDASAYTESMMTNDPTIPPRGVAVGTLRIAVGVLAVITWKETMKPILLRTLPPLFRLVEKSGLSHARRFFVQASEYGRVPSQLQSDNVIPSVSDFPKILTAIRHPKRHRSVSIGPQSAADAYETLAFRDLKRRESKSELQRSAVHAPFDNPLIDSEEAVYATDGERQGNGLTKAGCAAQERRDEERERKEIFSKLENPRVRYDVEVVTKLIVYAGIAWIAGEGGPRLFELLGLGAADLRPK